MCNFPFCLYFRSYTIKFTCTWYETKKKTDFLKVNLNMEVRISIWYIWIVDPSKMCISPSFQFARWLNTKKHYMNQTLGISLKHKYVYESRCFELAYLNYWLYEYAGFSFMSVGFTIIYLQTTENIYYRTRRAKWSEAKKLLFNSP